jgi:PAS domain-containing protein
MPDVVMSQQRQMMDDFQVSEEKLLYREAVVNEAIVLSVLVVVPLIILPLLFAYLLSSYKQERVACIMLFEEVPKNILRQCLDSISVFGVTRPQFAPSATNSNNSSMILPSVGTMLNMNQQANNQSMLARPGTTISHQVLPPISASSSGTNNPQNATKAPPLKTAAVRSIRITSAVKATSWYLALLLAIFCVAAIAMFLCEYLTWATTQYDPAEIVASGHLESAFAQSISFALTLRNREVGPTTNLTVTVKQLRDSLNAAESYYRDLRYGNKDRNTPGISKGRTFFLDLLYSPSCSDLTNAACQGLEQSLYSVSTRLRTFSYDFNNTALFDATFHDFEQYLNPMLDRFFHELAFDNIPTMKANAALTIGIYVVAVLLIAAVYTFCLAPSCDRLVRERKRLDALLVLLPRKVIVKNDELRGYLVDGDDLLEKTKSNDQEGTLGTYERDALGEKKVLRNARALREKDEITQVNCFEEVPDGMLEVGEGLHVVRCNRSAAAMFGMQSASIVGQHLSAVLRNNPEVIDRLQKQISAVLNNRYA